MKVKISAIILSILFLSFCISAPKMTPQEEAYINDVLNTPLTFTVAKDDSEETWGRIQSFVGKYSSMKLQTATDFVLQTYNPTGSVPRYGYTATKTPMGDEVEFQVDCTYCNMFTRKEAIQNAHILAYYALTGEVNPRFVHK